MRKLLSKNNLESYSDEDLLRQMKGSEGAPFAAELYKRYAHLVFGICMKYLKNRANSKDLSMDVFESFLKTSHPENLLSFKHWLLTVTKHKCLTFLRNNKREVAQRNDFQFFEKKSTNFMEYEDPWSLNDSTPEETPLLDALKQLKKPQKLCLTLFYIKGKSYKEIEKTTDYTLSQIKSYLQNGKRNLKLILENEAK